LCEVVEGRASGRKWRLNCLLVISKPARAVLLH
jgi:hypothetical protein